MSVSERSLLKQKIKRAARTLDISMIGFAAASRWERFPEYAPEYPAASRPQSIWPWCRTVIVLGVQIFPAMLETTPSVVYSELYNTTNRWLDEASYRLANRLNLWGYRAHFFPRDCYGDISALVKKPEAAFSHVIAARYAGLGTIGMNHTLLTPQFGPRVRFVSIITDADLPSDPIMKEELCIRCGRCVRACPMSAFTPREDSHIAVMNKFRCAAYHQKLKGEFRYPCGVCTAVCPVGADRRLYGPAAVTPQGVLHCRDYGSLNAVRDLPQPEKELEYAMSH